MLVSSVQVGDEKLISPPPPLDEDDFGVALREESRGLRVSAAVIEIVIIVVVYVLVIWKLETG